MNVFQTHADIVSDYATYIRSFLKIDDPAIRLTVEEALNQGKLWPEPLLQFNPSFEMYGTPPVTPPVARLLHMMAAGRAMSGAEIRSVLALEDKTHVRQTYLEPAMQQGLIEYTLPERPNSRLQQYRLTNKGRVLLAALPGNQP